MLWSTATASRCASSTSATTPTANNGSFGSELWEFNEHGLMRLRQASINDQKINEANRNFTRRSDPGPQDHVSLAELGF